MNPLARIYNIVTRGALDKERLQMQEELSKAIGDVVKKERKHNDTLENILSSLNSGLGQYKERTGVIDFDTLRKIARKNPIVAAIINTRVNQVASFAKQANIVERIQDKTIGFKIMHKYKVQNKMSKAEKKLALQIEDMIAKCGYTHRLNKQTGEKRDTFIQFLKKITRDRLIFDQVAFEKITNRKKEPAEFYAVDAATIRHATDKDKKNGIHYVQVVQGMVVNEYNYDEMGLCIANPRTDIDSNGYGFSEIEQLFSIVTAQLNADQYNAKFFSQGLGIPGILNLVTKDGKIPKDVMDALRNEFYAQAAGVQNAWRTPITNADKIEWVGIKPNNREMEYKSWTEYLIKICCAVFLIAPEEINFYFNGSGGSNAALFEGNQDSKIKYSRDKGLKSLLDNIADYITEHIVEPYDEDFCLQFVGIDTKDEKDLVDNRIKEGEGYKTMNEVRAEAGLPLLSEEDGGNIIFNPQYLNWLQQKAMASQFGGEDESEGDNEGDDEENSDSEEEYNFDEE